MIYDGWEELFLINFDYLFQEETDFKRDLPEWCTIDLLCAIEFAKKLPDLSKFSDSDKVKHGIF